MKISLKNSLNQTVTLTGQESNYQVISVLGLDPGKAVINTSTIVGVDGTRFNSARLNNRNIVVNLKINGDADTNRQNLYQKFPLKEEVTVTVTTNKTGTIKGHIEGISCNVFDQKQIMQISILCDDPYFYGTAWAEGWGWNTEGKSVTVTNNGEAGTGFELIIGYDGQIGQTEFSVSNGDSYLAFNFPSDAMMGYIRINTEKKTITLQEDGSDPVDAVPLLKYGSTFPVLPSGNSTIVFGNEQADFTAQISVPTKYGGM